LDARSLRAKLIRWYEGSRRDLPWRSTRDPYAIWISEIMLQQTRVAAVIPYYERFLARFPDAAALARAPEKDVLALWSGLGYYSRARNLQKAARQIEAAGAFPAAHDAILELAGVGAYTAAAIASISFGLPHAVVDGNVRRVVARLVNDANADVQALADRLLDKRDPASWNQAVMELGALVCLPREPRCLECPLAAQCEARAAGTQREIPGKKRKPATERLARTLLVIRRGGKILLAPSSRVKGFWDLPEPFPGARPGEVLGTFTHTITYRHYTFTVRKAAGTAPRGCRWFDERKLGEIPLGTVSKKALARRAPKNVQDAG
jgi:A/G-specific adenine glycosylase